MKATCNIKRYRRFAGWNYAKGASLFITIATEPRRALFGKVLGDAVALSPLGEKVKEALEAIPRLNPGILLFGHVVMPDHVHFNCALLPGLREPLKVLGNAIRRFKNYTTKVAKMAGLARSAEHRSAIKSGEAFKSGSSGFGKASSFDGQTTFGQSGHLWQQGYHDYILLSREMIDATERYIAYNPLKWELMYGEKGALRVIEPLFLPRFDAGTYWKGVGNIALLDPGEKLLSLRISRQVQGSAMAKMLARIESAVDQGYVIISGFISKGEQAVRDMLCRRSDARFIRILPSCIPNRRFRPESRYAGPFAEGRYLEIAQGNDEVEFGRRACLDINAEIIEIATAGDGLAIYWKGDGPHVLAEHSSAINAPVGVNDQASNVRGGHASQQYCLPGFDPRNDGQTGFGQKRRGQ